MKAICVKTGIWKDELTVGKEYEILEEEKIGDDTFFHLITDTGDELMFLDGKFKLKK